MGDDLALFIPNKAAPKGQGNMSHKSFEDGQAHFAAIIESSEDAIISKNLDGIVQSWNAGAERIFGYTAEEMVGKHISTLIPHDRLDEEHVILGKIRAGERIEHFETIRHAKSGGEVHVALTVSPIKDSSGRVIGASKIARDIGQAKTSERAAAYLAAIVESSDDIIISKTLDGVVTSWNKSAQRIFGYTSDEMIGQHIGVLIPEDKMDEEYAILARIKNGERVDHFETIRRTKDGRQVNVSLTVSPIRDKKGQVVGASKVARDITEQKRMAERMQEAAARRDEFMANISHELRTPMNAIIGLANILGASAAIPPEDKRYLATLKQSADDLMVLINNMLDFSKIENGSIEFEARDFDIEKTVEKVADLMRVQANERDVDLRVSCHAPLNRFYTGDGFRIQQVLMNLVGNAVKFTHKGFIEINVIGQAVEGNRQSVLFEIADTGIGIPEDKIDIIFDKFTQADASTTRKYGGSGLGLALVKSFVEAMGGSIRVESRVGVGSTFRFILPLQQSEQIVPLLSSETVLQATRKNVLVVEDYQPNVLVITSLLQRYGYDFDVAYNGAEAIQRYRDGVYNVILMDVQMDEMDGMESTIRIRNLEKDKGKVRTPIIAMTAHVQESDKNKCLDVGMDDFMPKPFDPDILKKKLAAYIPAGKQ